MKAKKSWPKPEMAALVEVLPAYSPVQAAIHMGITRGT